MSPNARPGGVASGHREVTRAAAEILRAGGNAYDAAIAAGFASTVVEPALTSLGGGGLLLARTSGGDEIVFNFFSDTPGRGLESPLPEPHFVPVTVNFGAAVGVYHVGLGSIAVPGVLRGLLYVHRRLGRLPLAEILDPAIRLAEDGVVLNRCQSKFLSLLGPIMTLTERSRALFAPGGELLDEGARLTNPDLARYLRTLPEDGDREFYEGEIADRIADEMDAGNGLLRKEDLSRYEVREEKPLAGRYRGHRVLGPAPPMLGGSLIIRGLEVLESTDLSPGDRGTRRYLDALARCFEKVHRWSVERLPGDPWPPAARRGTTHLSIVDREQNVASLTTSNGEGSGYIAPETGIMLNNMLGEEDLHPHGFHAMAPGIRIPSMMAPTVLLDDAGVRAVLGSGGSSRILTAVIQVVSRLVDLELSVEEAVTAPRVHWDGRHLQIEPGFSSEEMATLREAWSVNVWSRRGVYFGGVHAVCPGAGCAGDPRRDGFGEVVG